MPHTSPPQFFASASHFRDWLASFAASHSALLVGFGKVGSGLPSLSWPEAVDEALCVGWIDGVRRRVDDQRYSIRFTPRRPGSHWSAVNIARVADLQAQGRMQAAGLTAFSQRSEARTARAAYEQPGMPSLPPAALAVLQAQPDAWRFFLAQPPGYRKQLIWRVISAKQAATQARRLALLIAACAERRRL